MTQSQLSKVWFVVSALLLYYALNSWVVAQGGEEIFGAKVVMKARVPAVMIAIPICSILLTLTSLVGRLYSLRAGSKWHERIPVVGFEGIDTGSREGRVYQGVMITVFSLLPAIALVYFWCTFLSATVMLNDGKKDPGASLWDWSQLRTLNDPARICTEFHKELADPCIGNATVLPGLEPTIFGALTLAAVVVLAMHWRAVVMGQLHEPPSIVTRGK
ncbi:hypothetical protein EN873_14860 [bacterium M00.F.Ca.ET.230.01.1.1]|nr:hypothetical protein EN873_14860 [bacterium M00.F.Ca.ET.230.01.1.1]